MTELLSLDHHCMVIASCGHSAFPCAGIAVVVHEYLCRGLSVPREKSSRPLDNTSVFNNIAILETESNNHSNVDVTRAVYFSMVIVVLWHFIEVALIIAMSSIHRIVIRCLADTATKT